MSSEDPQSHSSMPKLVAGLSVVAVLLVVGIVWLLCSALIDSRTSAERHRRVQELCGTIMHLDEVLTMSAKMCAATGNMDWKKRYDTHVLNLESAIRQAEALVPLSGRKPSEDIGAANDRLVEMEQRAFGLTAQGKRQEAMDLLESDQYERDKKQYSKATQDRVAAMLRDVQASLTEERWRSGSIIAAAIVAMCLILASCSVSLVAMRRHLDHRRRTEDELRDAREKLEHRVEERTAELARDKTTLKQLLESSDRELKLIAYEIHDGLAQLLTAAVMQCQTHDRQKDANPEEASQACAAVSQLLAKSLSEVRRLISKVRLPLLDECGVVAAVRNLVYEISNQSEAEIEFHSQVTFGRLEPVVENAIYRIVQEGLANAMRYSKSDRVRVALGQDDQHVRLEIADCGVGFDAEKVGRESYGLAGIRERARLLGGHASIDSTPGKGTRIVVQLPLTEEVASLRQ